MTIEQNLIYAPGNTKNQVIFFKRVQNFTLKGKTILPFTFLKYKLY